MKTWEEINPIELLSLEDFLTLFEKAPLIEEEIKDLKEFYFPIYETFLKAEVTPENAWVATRNIFVIKNLQIGDRIKANAPTGIKL